MNASNPADAAHPVTTQVPLSSTLRRRRDDGRKLLVPYVTAGITSDWLDLVTAVVEAGADAVEIGIPFSDPSVDGPTIQEASVQALANGMTPPAALDALAEREFDVPLIVMTYYNLVYRYGHQRFAGDAARAGVTGTILPDLPIERADDWLAAAEPVGIENVLLVAPVSTDDRLRLLAERTGGFLYAVSTMGTTGERAELDQAAGELTRRVRAVSDVPVLVGFGISTPEHAVAATRHADGVITASALMRRVLSGAGVDEAAELIASMRSALDAPVG